MYCKECGQSLPDDALFCSRCRTRTQTNTCGDTDTDRTTQASPQPKNELQQERFSAYQLERLHLANEETRQILEDAVTEARQKRNTLAGIYGFISAFCGLVAILSFYLNTEYTIGLMMTILLSFSISMGFLGGVIKVCNYWYPEIRKREYKLDQFDSKVFQSTRGTYDENIHL